MHVYARAVSIPLTTRRSRDEQSAARAELFRIELRLSRGWRGATATMVRRRPVKQLAGNPRSPLRARLHLAMLASREGSGSIPNPVCNVSCLDAEVVAG